MLGYPLTPATTSWSCGRPVSSMPRAARTSPDMMDRVTECDAENGVRRMSTEDASARRKKSLNVRDNGVGLLRVGSTADDHRRSRGSCGLWTSDLTTRCCYATERARPCGVEACAR